VTQPRSRRSATLVVVDVVWTWATSVEGRQQRARGTVGAGTVGDRRLRAMTVTVDLPDDVLRRLKAEADRRGVTLDGLLADVAGRFPAEAEPIGQAEGLRKLTGIAPGISGAYSKDEDWPE